MPGELSREFKIHLIKAVFHKEYFDRILENANPYQLSDIQEFLWEALLYVGRDEQGEKLKRDDITGRMVPTVDYWRSQLCGEPLDTCRGRSCFVSHPVCAGNKLKGQIETIRQMFDRRRQRAQQENDALVMTLMYYVNENEFAAGGIYTASKQPHLTVGSRVLDGPTLNKVIGAMSSVMESHSADTPGVYPFVVGDARLEAHVSRCDCSAELAYIAVVTPEGTGVEPVLAILKKIVSAVSRIHQQTGS